MCWISSRCGFAGPKRCGGRLDPGSGESTPHRQGSSGNALPTGSGNLLQRHSGSLESDKEGRAIRIDDTRARFTHLSELKAAGVLTEAEFASQKARILGG
jgi:hypothetical protein